MSNQRLARVKTWALYYGHGCPQGLLANDLVVVAPEAWNATGVREARRRGAIMVAYLSVLEVPRVPDTPPPANVLWVDGVAADQPAWGTWILDPRHPDTRARLLHAAGALAAVGFDGFFLDTIGDVENRLLPARLRSLIVPAAAGLVADLRSRFPEQVLVQNWALGATLDLTAPYLDGVCWEDFPLGYPLPWQESVAVRLRAVAGRGLTVLTLSSQAPAKLPMLAAQLGFPWYGAPGAYTAFRASGEGESE